MIEPRGLSLDDAATYAGCKTVSAFKDWVRCGLMPGPLPLPGVEVYDRRAIDLVKKNIRSVGEPRVYVISFGGYVKIGWSRNVAKRIAEIERGLPEAVTVHHVQPGSKIDEGRLHKRFSGARLRGEWFRKEADLLTWIEAGCP